MKLQLTKTKTIEIAFPGGKARGSSGLSDVTGVLLNSGDSRGCPAVRLQCRKGVYQVLAAGFVPPPVEAMPDSWESVAKQSFTWSLPTEFQAPHAALAVMSDAALVRQTSPDALLLDLGASSGNAPATQVKAGDVKAGQPVSTLGMRFVTQPLAEAPFVLQSGLPEFQVLWASRLLPEGRRPTACSVQTMPAALLSSVRLQPEFAAADGNALVVYALRNSMYLAAYRDGELLMFRQCPGVAGWEMMREGVKLRLGIDDEMVDAILDDVIVDPRSAMEPFVRPVLQQLEISLDYLASRHGMRLGKAFVMGLPSGARYWSQMAEEMLHVPLVSPSVFEGLTLPVKDSALRNLTSGQTQVYLAALGAARAAMEGNA